MMPRVVQDAGYTAVGLGVMALRQVQNRRRAVRAALGPQVSCLQSWVGAVMTQAKQVAQPIATQAAGLVPGRGKAQERAS